MDTSILCTNGGFVVCSIIGFFAGSIWSLFDTRFDSFLLYRVVRFSAAVIGAAAGLVLDHYLNMKRRKRPPTEAYV
jgi:hypothetical protein